MTKISTTTFAAALLAASILSTGAQAADTSSLSGLYLEGQAGLNLARDVDLDADGVSGDFELDNGAVFSGAVGYHLNNNLRVEGEVSYRKNDVDSATISDGVTTLDLDGAGSAKTTLYMLNGWYDFKNSSAITPFIGGGVGLAHISTDADDGAFVVIDDSDTVFAYQLGAGASMAVTDRLSLTAGYRWIDTADAKLDSSIPVFGLAGDSEGDYQAHEIRVGARYSF